MKIKYFIEHFGGFRVSEMSFEYVINKPLPIIFDRFSAFLLSMLMIPIFGMGTIIFDYNITSISTFLLVATSFYYFNQIANKNIKKLRKQIKKQNKVFIKAFKEEFPELDIAKHGLIVQSAISNLKLCDGLSDKAIKNLLVAQINVESGIIKNGEKVLREKCEEAESKEVKLNLKDLG